MANKITIIDGNSLLFRAYYATAYSQTSIMQTKDGIPTNAIFAFANMISKIINQTKENEAIFVAFDMDSQTFRKEKLESYKANRKPLPEELIKQFPIARDFLKSLGIFYFEKHGYEADDLAGTIAKKAEKEGYIVNIYTSDKDYLQLASNNISIYILKKGLSDIDIMTPITIKEKFGFEPLQIIDYKGLRGDPSDNLTGIKGIGEITAVKLINEYHDFDNIIKNADNIKGKVGQLLKEHENEGRLSRDLAIIDCNVNVDFDIKDCIYKGYDFDTINKFCLRYELRQFLNKLPKQWKKASFDENNINSSSIKTLKDFPINDEIGLAIDYSYENYLLDPIYGFAIFNDDQSYCYIDYENALKDEYFKNIIANKNIKKSVFNYKSALVIFKKMGISLQGVDYDSLIASYIIDTSLSSNDPYIVLANFGFDISSLQEESLLTTNDINKTIKIARANLLCKQKGLNELKQVDGLDLFYNIEMPLSEVLADMESEGFPLNKEKLLEIGAIFKEKQRDLEEEIYSLSECKFNIASPKQIGDILFDKLHLPDLKNRSTSIEALEGLVNLHPIVGKIIEYRKYFKLNSTYIDGLLSHLHKDGKIHAMFNQALTSTGRLSSSNPNLQNISVRDEEAKTIRKAFYYDEDDVIILSFDYSQIELRILASLSNCQLMIDTFNNGDDIHSSTAKVIFNTDNPTHLERQKAKAVNFGIVYGISDWGLASQINAPLKDAKKIIDDFYKNYPQIGQFLQNVVINAKKDGYVKTICNRRRYLREINATNYQQREFAKRAAMNAPIQGSAADIIKIAMIKIANLLKDGNYKSKLVLQIHDELIFKIYKDELDVLYPLIKENMENAYPLKVKLIVSGGYGKTWYDAK